ncbi:hypothetical protein QE152_g31863 [Popillia japonica]|uniref:THAP domain-containing protein 9 n=1 Tax=Popillia japonica TaxID=7064 RepID=A0AAW1J1R4_POPJA
MAMCKSLGAVLDWKNNMKPWIIHPSTKEKVYIILDACHMIKLIRNSLAKVEFLQTINGKATWLCIKKLQSYQSKQGLLAGNKLTGTHINFEQKIMNVHLAAQVLSKSVSAALRFCQSDLELSQFEDSEATSIFCEIFNNAFDILNSRCTFAKYQYNRPISEATYKSMKLQIREIINYIENVKLPSGQTILTSQKKTGFLGIIINLKNVFNLYDAYHKRNLKYLSTYKLSQDHLEIFFSAVRSRFGMNNNPSALQFKYAYKRLLTRAQIGGSIYGNVTELSYMPILYATPNITPQEEIDTIFDMDNEDVGDHDYLSSFYTLSPFIEDIIKYIAGYVTKKVVAEINCNKYKEAIITQNCTSSLQKKKSMGYPI